MIKKFKKMTDYINPNSDYIDKRIEALQKSSRWNTTFINTSHCDFISDLSHNIFTNIVHSTFSASYVRKFPCSDCGDKDALKDRCHGIGESRLVLMKRALERVWPDTTKEIKLKTILIAFLEEHKNTKFTFKCKPCHRKEPKS